jgi:hypothetical protein
MASFERVAREREEDNQFFKKQMEKSLRESQIQNEASRLLQSALKRRLSSNGYESAKKQEKSIRKSFTVLDIESSIKKDKELGRGLLLQPSDLFELTDNEAGMNDSQPAKRGRGRPAGSKNKKNVSTFDIM